MSRALNQTKMASSDLIEQGALEELSSLKEVCSLLMISEATGRNWIKKGRIHPVDTSLRGLMFKKSEVEALNRSLSGDDSQILTTRRNKKHKKGIQVPSGYLGRSAHERYVHQLGLLVGQTELCERHRRLIIAEYAMKLLNAKGLLDFAIPETSYVKALREGLADFGVLRPLLMDLVQDGFGGDLPDQFESDLMQLTVPAESKDDFLGYIHMALQCIGQRKIKGVYYTPYKVVKSTLTSLLSCERGAFEGQVLDPCCGTGQFLIQVAHLKNEMGYLEVAEGYSYYGCHGYDVDALSIHITRINMILVSGKIHLESLYRQFVIRDTLLTPSYHMVDCILGNPPWGYTFSKIQVDYLKKHYTLASEHRLESFSLFIEWAMHHLKNRGCLTYVLPESALNVKVHRPLRAMMRENLEVRGIDFLENPFDGVYMPAIGLVLSRKQANKRDEGIVVNQHGQRYTVLGTRFDQDDSLLLRPTDQALDVLSKMNGRSSTCLQGRATFAMGIVTGDNASHLYQIKGKDCVPLIIGKDVTPYTIKPSEVFVQRWDAFQQMAPLEIYDAPEKLVYRFIADHPIVAYDTECRMTLNSCNVIIPHIEGYSLKVILALLNSTPLAFYYKTKFPSMKVLKSNLERLPIPTFTEGEKTALEIEVDKVLIEKEMETKKCILNHIDRIVATAFGLTALQLSRMETTLNAPRGQYTEE